ncbi:hypothetical protein BOQ64_04255 [Chryseobacterium sp. CH25]|nr:hypothetical protein BOQ64_04255 [Chryseobacterium sp. CH25]RXM63534.1 hypothetical protein BOQ60_16430 [Chryseobacterium sp. CH1]
MVSILVCLYNFIEINWQWALHKTRNGLKGNSLTTPSKIIEFLPPLRRRGMFSPSTGVFVWDRW